MIVVSLCCNDPDNGIFTGRVSAIEFGEALHLAHVRRSEPRLRIDWWTENHLTIYMLRHCWPIARYKYGYGNWCWNAVWMEDGAAISFVHELRRDGRFECESGDAEAYDAWKTGQTITRQMLGVEGDDDA